MSKTFEEALPIINKIIILYKSRWTLASYSYEDISQDIRIRAFKKWPLYDVKKGSVEQWASTLCSNFIKNALRDKYYIFAPPCLRCAMFLGENQCKLYGEVSLKCDLYRKFFNQKNNAANINFPVSYEQSEYDARQEFSCDAKDLAKEIYTQISGIHSEIFNLFYASGLSTTRIARTIQISGCNFKKRVDFIQESLNATCQKAKGIMQDKQVAAGAWNG